PLGLRLRPVSSTAWHAYSKQGNFLITIHKSSTAPCLSRGSFLIFKIKGSFYSFLCSEWRRPGPEKSPPDYFGISGFFFSNRLNPPCPPSCPGVLPGSAVFWPGCGFSWFSWVLFSQSVKPSVSPHLTWGFAFCGLGCGHEGSMLGFSGWLNHPIPLLSPFSERLNHPSPRLFWFSERLNHPSPRLFWFFERLNHPIPLLSTFFEWLNHPSPRLFWFSERLNHPSPLLFTFFTRLFPPFPLF